MTAQPTATTPTGRYLPSHPIIFLLEAKARRRWLAAQQAIRARETPKDDDRRDGDRDPQPAA